MTDQGFTHKIIIMYGREKAKTRYIGKRQKFVGEKQFVAYCVFAPCSIQQRINSRSSSVILVLLFWGIVLVRTTR